tara:strand:+ start:38 stop:448 length:411 start_codon:yes stop_codon:yes gene_type:complete
MRNKIPKEITNLSKSTSTKFLESLKYMIHWVSVIPDLSAVEVFRMLQVNTELTSDEIPSKTRIHEILTYIKEVQTSRESKMSDRYKTTLARARRKLLLDLMSEKRHTDDDFVRLNLTNIDHITNSRNFNPNFNPNK